MIEFFENSLYEIKNTNKYACFLSQKKVRSGNTLIKINCRKNEPMSEIVAGSNFFLSFRRTLVNNRYVTKD